MVMDLQHPRALVRVTGHKRAEGRYYFAYALLALLYSVILYNCYMTAGQPYARALAEGMDLAVKKGTAPPPIDFHSKAVGDLAKRMGGARSSPKFEFDIGNDDWGEEDSDEVEKVEETVSDGKVVDNTEDTEDIDDDDDDDDTRSLPSKYLPDVIPSICLFLLLTLTALFPLLCHWSVDFKARMLFSNATDISSATHLLVRPHMHRGKASLEKIFRSKCNGKLGFEFQRQKYIYLSADELKAHHRSQVESKEEKISSSSDGIDENPNEIIGNGAENGAVQLVQCVCNAPLSYYVDSGGIVEEKFGLNRMSITMPSFLELYRNQLLAPLCIFQFFVAFLWLLDEYWQYTLFSIFSIFMLESTTTFQRRRTMQTLAGMAQKPYPIQVFRHNIWSEMTTAELLPGDLISIRAKIKEKVPKPMELMNPKEKEEELKRRKEIMKRRKEQAIRAGGVVGVHSDIIPCDCVLISGNAVVNESSLTGESVPQMKDALQCRSDSDAKRNLAPDGRDRVHILFAGTSLITASPGKVVSNGKNTKKTPIITPPDGGSLCYVMRTGFSSSQGELMQMIEFASTQKVSGDSKEIGLALLLLLFFALVASGYVLKKGLEKGDRTTHELLLKCVIMYVFLPKLFLHLIQNNPK